MVKIWQFWEFEHPSNCMVRVIDTPSGLELFAVDVLQIINPELDTEKVKLINIVINKRFIKLNNSEVTLVSTLSALSIHSLTSMVNRDVVRSFMQWVRSRIIPVFNQEVITVSSKPRYLFQTIDYQKKDSLIKYLYFQSKSAWSETSIDLYLKLIDKRIPLAGNCPQAVETESLLSRKKYLKLVIKIVEAINSYERVYEDLVLTSPNLLLAQELDLLVYYQLKKLNIGDLNNVIEQGLVLQAMQNMANNLSNQNFRDLKPLYLNLLEHFSTEMLSHSYL